MAGRFNSPAALINSTKVKNYEGDTAYSLSPEMELYSAVCTANLSRKFYETQFDSIVRLRDLIAKCRPTFVAKLAVYAREQMYLRSIPLVLAVELAKIHHGDNLVGRLTARIVQRADEICELLAYYQQANENNFKRSSTGQTKKLGKLSKQIRLGLEQAFNKFNEYQFSKYNRDNEIKLKDALFVIRPRPKNQEQADIFKKIADGDLTTADTWEVELSKTGQKGGDKKSAWENLIKENKLGYMALLRNCRNIMEAGVSKDVIKIVCQKLSDKEKVLESKQFPFRFYSAFSQLREIPGSSIVLDALEEAIKHTAETLVGFDYETSVLISCDVSGSMESPISEKSVVQRYDIGIVLGMLMRNRCKDVTTSVFGQGFAVKNFPKDNILHNVENLEDLGKEVGHSTNGYLAIKYALEQSKNKQFDKILIFTDCQMWDSHGSDGMFRNLWNLYRENNPKSRLYLFDLAGYGNTPIEVDRGNNVYLISGWSDRIFQMLEALENGSKNIDEIEKISI